MSSNQPVVGGKGGHASAVFADRSVAWLSWCLAALAVAARLTPPWAINHDCAWFLLVADRFLSGDRLYVDIVDVNPPLIIYLTAIPVWLAKGLGLGAVPVFQALVLALAAGSAWCTELPQSLRHQGGRLLLFALLAGYPAGNFGQREHLTLLLMLPYLGLVARRWSGVARLVAANPEGAVANPQGALAIPVRGAVAQGVLAGIGIALKPFFLLVPLLLALAGALRQGGLWRRLVAAENLGIAGFCFAYGAHFVAVPFRDAFLAHVGVVTEVYGAFRVSPSAFLRRPGTLHALFALAALGLALVALRKRRTPRVMELRAFSVVLIVALLGCLAAAAWQGKGWSYHLLPAEFLGVLGLLWLPWGLGGAVLRGLLLLALCGWSGRALGQHWIQRDATTGGWEWSAPFTGIPDDLARVRGLRPGQSVLVLNTNMHTFWAYLLDNDIRWASRHACLWQIPGTVPAKRSLLREEIWADLRQLRPDLVFVRRGPLGFLDEEPDFDLIGWLRPDSQAAAAAWAPFEVVAADGPYAVFRRR